MDMNTYVISKDPAWHRIVDVIVILAIGFVAGVILSGALITYETETTTVKSIKRVPSVQTPQDQSGKVDAPQDTVKVLEI